MWRDRLRRAGLGQLERLGLQLGGSHPLLRALAAEAIFTVAKPSDWSRLTARSYDRNPRYLDPSNRRLFTWERAAVDELFPPPPARILIGAAGGGREMVGLAELGYDVAGFEPGRRLAATAKRLVVSERLLGFEVLAYEDLISGGTAIERHAPYDATILGWGSLSHVGSREVRQRLLSKVRLLCPVGPLLLSWVDDRPGDLQLRLRRALARLGVATRPEGEGYSLHGGFSRSYTHEEIFALAHDTGYQVCRYSEGDFPHALLRPRS